MASKSSRIAPSASSSKSSPKKKAPVPSKTDIRADRFVAEFLLDMNATKAAIRAGAPEAGAAVAGHRMLRNANIAQRIALAVQEKASKLDLSAERVLRGLLEEATSFGEGTTQAARVAAWTQLGRYHQLFVDRIDATVTHVYVNMTDEELAVEFHRLRSGAAPKQVDDGKAKRLQ